MKRNVNNIIFPKWRSPIRKGPEAGYAVIYWRVLRALPNQR